MKCVSCGKDVTNYVAFKCPNCEGEEKYKIIRCDACRAMGRKYVCPKCGWTCP
ncbi:MAG: RNA-binding protein [Candidatus Altiarchaeum hamiconexum]|uniref:RNA-binding protein n=1 Tax=Candidatus Altarchaeum hamiconexum TaxID=1803513 RepID=A0A8J8CEV9_9ARCH|nr:RNA-binding protein [Candidatus Altarchaeum hamiconexum]PIN67094.1 MAG: RNA-binding protein [Candidatus Altarchaeum sp. CG12_big_fil_rev_8_21_14_0_65_33_22]PIV27439.1 MAG: RNA-binding protein [Candidatus Altarchaeum sp. CG03_land_8_20_14_0_80_32_618]PIX48561.1 MAG: RNA-binding protein [Candidatus Altarchaeum sp. CG_4_8_14_3_um_filter_33_2054]PIZ32547.1 MAG: RNA-binding protein [Candidatus Altarchaeum sp. CG_4_10_14_0_8_um_filter_32_851]PJC15206.1 MAG: RNA-binding protein [Candidatus Altarch